MEEPKEDGMRKKYVTKSRLVAAMGWTIGGKPAAGYILDWTERKDKILVYLTDVQSLGQPGTPTWIGRGELKV